MNLSTKQIVGLCALVLTVGAAIPQIDSLARWWSSHEVAYAAQNDIKDIKEYVNRLDTYIQVQQAQQSAAVRRTPILEYDKDSKAWCCDSATAEQCWKQATWYEC